jgi:HAD superfamily hydrolase (TIGR01509 family)
MVMKGCVMTPGSLAQTSDIDSAIVPSVRRGLFLDLDGTLADSLSVMQAVFVAFHARYGLTCTDADFELANGPPLSEIVGGLRSRHGLPGTRDELLAEYWRLIDAEFAGVAAVEGAEELLRVASERGWISAVVTSSSERLAREWLRHRALDGYVSDVIGAESVHEGKPSPVPYRLALDRTGAEVGASLAVEDSRSGVTSARGAGLFTFFLDRRGEGARPDDAAPPGARGGLETIRSLREVLPRIA